MVWLIAGLPLAAVVAGLTTVWIASRNADSLVKDGYAKEGFTVQETLDQDRVAARLGLSARIGLDGETLSVRVNATAGTYTPPSLLLLTLAHPTDATKDAAIVVKYVGDGKYQARMSSFPEGKRRLLLESHEQGWRLKGTADAPFAGGMLLSPVRADS